MASMIARPIAVMAGLVNVPLRAISAWVAMAALIKVAAAPVIMPNLAVVIAMIAIVGVLRLSRSSTNQRSRGEAQTESELFEH